jgi:hypothetical protein
VFSTVLLRPAGIQNINDAANHAIKKQDFVEQFLKPENDLRI